MAKTLRTAAAVKGRTSVKDNNNKNMTQSSSSATRKRKQHPGWSEKRDHRQEVVISSSSNRVVIHASSSSNFLSPSPMKNKNLTAVSAPQKKKHKNLLRTILLGPSYDPMSYYHKTTTTITTPSSSSAAAAAVTTLLMELPPCTPLLPEFNNSKKQVEYRATPRVLLEQFEDKKKGNTTTTTVSPSGISADDFVKVALLLEA